MRIEVIPAGQLSEDLVSVWREIQQSEASLASPYLCPEFIRAVGEVYPHTYVGVMEESGTAIGFLPFERYSRRSARGVARSRTDYQAVIVDSRAQWDPGDLLRGCDLCSLEFDHLIASQQAFRAYHRQVTESHVISLRAGRRVVGKGHCEEHRLRKRARQAAQEIGPVRTEIENHSAAVLGQLIEMKRKQYARLGVGDGFDRLMRELVERLHAMHGKTFAGVFSVLYIGDSVAAAHFGLRSHAVWHWWFPSYDARFARYSPGLLLLRSMIDAVRGLGLQAIDLGYGDEPYKLHIANDSVPVASAVVGASWPALLRQYTQAVKRYVRGTRLAMPVRKAYRGLTNRLTTVSSMLPIGARR